MSSKVLIVIIMKTDEFIMDNHRRKRSTYERGNPKTVQRCIVIILTENTNDVVPYIPTIQGRVYIVYESLARDDGKANRI